MSDKRVINATFVGVDDWSRVIIETEGGTRLCDVSCTDPEVIKANPDAGDWYTIVGDYDEPCSRIRSDIRFRLTGATPAPEDQPEKPDTGAPANSQDSESKEVPTKAILTDDEFERIIRSAYSVREHPQEEILALVNWSADTRLRDTMMKLVLLGTLDFEWVGSSPTFHRKAPTDTPVNQSHERAVEGSVALDFLYGRGCPECGSRKLTWHADTKNYGGAVDGRICMREVGPIFALGCDDCSETISVISGDKVAEVVTKFQRAMLAGNFRSGRPGEQQEEAK